MFVDYRDEWLSRLGQRVNIPKLAFDPEGLCQISLDKEFVITVCKQFHTHDLVLFGQLPVNPPDYLSAELLQRMLIENRNHSKLTSPVISLSTERDAIEVHFKLSQHELIDTTEDVVGQLIEHLEHWRGFLTGSPR